MAENMIEIKNAVMDFHIQHENINSFKEFLVNAVRGKLKYDHFRAVDHVNLQVKTGEVCGIIGRNGAGKSTLLKMIAGVLTPSEGSIQLGGNIAPMLELGAGFDADLTAKENVYLNGAISGYSKSFLDRKYEEIVQFAELEDFMNQPVRTFSSGMMMRLAFSIATQINPEILIVDEILSVGDSHFRLKSETRMREMMSGGTTVLMVSHSLPQIRSMCSHVLWLERGKVMMDGDSETVCDAYEGMIDYGNAPQMKIGSTKEEIQRVTMYADNWMPSAGTYKIRTGEKGRVMVRLYCPYADLDENDTIEAWIEEETKMKIPAEQGFVSFELSSRPNSVVKVHIDCSFSRFPGNGDIRELCIVLDDTQGK